MQISWSRCAWSRPGRLCVSAGPAVHQKTRRGAVQKLSRSAAALARRLAAEAAGFGQREPRIQRVESLRLLSASRVDVTLREVDLDSTNFALDLLFEILEPVVRRELARTARELLREALPSSARTEAIRRLGLASAPPTVPAGPAPEAALLARARETSQRLFEELAPLAALNGLA